MEYSPEEHLAAHLKGLPDAAALYDVAILQAFHQTIHVLDALHRTIESKTEWESKERIRLIFEFFVTDVTSVMVEEIKKAVNRIDSSNPDPNDHGGNV